LPRNFISSIKNGEVVFGKKILKFKSRENPFESYLEDIQVEDPTIPPI
jgi:hypothetical protein